MDNWNLQNTFEFDDRDVKFGISGKGEPLVLVHGTPWSSFNYRHLIAKLSSEFKVYYFDLLGYGQSDKSDSDVSLGIQNQLLDALIDHWQLEMPFIVGHDFGGATVLRNHILDKRQFKKIVLIDPVALSPWGSPFFKHVRENEHAFSGVPDYIHEAIVTAYVKTAAYKDPDEETMRGILTPWLGEKGKPAFYRQIAQADAKFTDVFQDRFSEVSAPVLILWGEEDQWIPCEQAYQLQSRIEGAALRTIADAGHLVIEEKPDELVKEILAFLSHKLQNECSEATES